MDSSSYSVIQSTQSSPVVQRPSLLDPNESGNNENKLQIGDRVVAIDSTLGVQMWLVSTVEGLVSACTTRLPGQPVKLRIERAVVNTEKKAVNKFETVSQQTTSTTATSTSSTTTTSNVDTEQHKLLLSRSLDLLRRYTSNANTSPSSSSSTTTAQSRSSLNSLPTIVADRILDTLSEASVPLDYERLFTEY